MRCVFFDIIIHNGGASQLASDISRRLAIAHDVEVLDAFGACGEYIESLRKNNIKTTVLVPNVQRSCIGANHNKFLRIWRMLKQLPTFWQLRNSLIRQLRQINPDVIWTNSFAALLLLSFSRFLRNFPVAMYVCGCPDAKNIKGWQRWVMRNTASRLMAISTETATQLKLAGMEQDRIDIVFDTIVFEDTLKRSSKPTDTPLSGIDGYPRIILPATLLRTKGQHTAIKAIGRLKHKGFKPTLWLAGDIVGNDMSYLNYLKQLTTQYNVNENVYFLGWRNDVPAIIKQSDILVLPTHTEGFGHVILEAMLLKRPAIATPVGGIKDSIQDGYNGLLFPIDDDEKLADNIICIVNDKQLAVALVENGYQTVTQRFNPQLHTERVVAALTKMVNNKILQRN
jgi:glycosyltransferase involved in cell wall biosynthesis